jgi:hypothetical protein
LKFAEKDKRIEAVHLNLFKDQVKLKDLSIDLSRKGRSPRLLSYFKKLMKDSPVEDKENHIRVALDRESLKYIDIKKLAALYERGHKDVTIQTSNLRTSRVRRSELFSQVAPFLRDDELKRLQMKVKNKLPLDLHADLLSGFAKRMTGKYTIFRGPNCFHAALAFHTRDMSESPFLNVKVEKGYHRAMINYDELWKAINHHFYEIDPRNTELKYGDLLVFMDVPDDSRSPYFKWIRHAATYLVGQYTFSKGSKSPNTPYSIKTLQEEWRTWQGFTDNLRVKVFRRNQNHVNKRPPRDLTDWIY